MWSFHEMKLNLPSKVYSILGPLRAILSSLKRSYYTKLEIQTSLEETTKFFL